MIARLRAMFRPRPADIDSLVAFSAASAALAHVVSLAGVTS